MLKGVVVLMSHRCLHNVKIDVFMSCSFNKCPLAIWKKVESGLCFFVEGSIILLGDGKQLCLGSYYL